MFGTKKKYNKFRVEQFTFPKIITAEQIGLKDEAQFIEFFVRNDWLQRMVGIKCKHSNGLYPDLLAEIYDGTGDKIRVEAEYWAENYAVHQHRYGGCHLILSLLRSPYTRIVRGVPVWSFYKGSRNSNSFEYCLDEDMNYDFDKHGEVEEPLEHYGY